jgi:hypothetical protein
MVRYFPGSALASSPSLTMTYSADPMSIALMIRSAGTLLPVRWLTFL